MNVPYPPLLSPQTFLAWLEDLATVVLAMETLRYFWGSRAAADAPPERED